MGREGKTDRERESGSEKEGGGKYRVKLHRHTFTYTDNLTSMLLVQLWRMKELYSTYAENFINSY